MVTILPLLLAMSINESNETLVYKDGTVEVITDNEVPKDKILHNKMMWAINPKDFKNKTKFAVSAHNRRLDSAAIATICSPLVNIDRVEYTEVYYIDGKLSHKKFVSSQREAGIQFIHGVKKVDVFASSVHEVDYDKVVDYIVELSQ